MVIKEKFVREQIDNKREEVEETLNNEDEFERKVKRIERKLKKIPKLGDKLSVIPVIISLVRAYVRKEYTDIPYASIISATFGLIYFLSPFDLFPDGIPFVGYVDDAAVLAIVFSMIEDDVEEYKVWRENNKQKF